MEEQTAQKKHPTKTRKRKRRGVGPYPFEMRLRAVQMYVEEGYPAQLITAEMGITGETLNKWAKLYRQSGEEASETKDSSKALPTVLARQRESSGGKEIQPEFWQPEDF